MSRALRGLTAGVLVLSGAIGPAFAQSAGGTNAECRSNPHLARARELYDDLQFDEAAQTLQRAIEYSDNCRWDLGEIYRLKAFVDAINGERERCLRDFEIFLALNPEFEMPPDVAPKIRHCFEDARTVAPSRRELALEHTPPVDVPANSPVGLKVRVVDPLRLVDQVRVYFRREGVKIYTVVSARASDELSVVIPALALPSDPQGYRMEFLVRSVDRWGGVLVEQGTARRPLKFFVQPGTIEGAVTGRWWFWAALAVGALGVGAATFALVRQESDAVSVTLIPTVDGD